MKLTRQLLIFDLDGVLVDETKTMHYDALIKAISIYNPTFEVTKEAQEIMETSLTSKQKLAQLSQAGCPINQDTLSNIISEKLKITNHFINNLEENEKLIALLSKIREHSQMAVASNSSSETVNKILHAVGISQFISYVVGNDMVINNKPHPEVFWSCMSELSYFPDECVIFEDSPQGQAAALSSGARLEKINNNNHLMSILEEKYV